MDWDTLKTAVWQVFAAPIDYVAFAGFLTVRFLWGVHRQRRRLREFIALNGAMTDPVTRRERRAGH